MMNRLKTHLRTRAGKGIFFATLFLAGAVIYINISGFFAGSTAARLSRRRIYIDAVTGKVFECEVQPGERIPVPAPSGQRSGYPAEMCYWTRDGKVRADPFPVLLNQYINKTGPTFCPDCGRLVIMQNAPPKPGQRPPPTPDEYALRRQDFPDGGE